MIYLQMEMNFLTKTLVYKFIKLLKVMYKISNSSLIKSASYLSVITAIIVMLVKAYGWLYTDSQSIFASLIDSMLDISSSVINLIAIRLAFTPADDNHRFGHEKFQDLAIFSQSMFFLASCLFILFSSFKSLFLGDVVENIELGKNVMYICTILTFALVAYQVYVIYKTKSLIIAADNLHYFSDLLSNVAVIGSLYLSSNFWYVDSLAGILIAIYMMRGSYILLRRAIRNLADEELPQADKDKIVEIVRRFKEARGVHELKTRYAAEKPFIQFHLEMEASLSLRRAHDISETIAACIIKEFPGAEVIIHQDPEGEERNVKYREEF